MTRKIVQLVLLTLLGCAPAPSGGDKVVNGEASLIEDHPYIVSLQMFVRDGSGRDVFMHFCGASIVSENLIVTAAHCLTDLVAAGGAPRLRVVAARPGMITARQDATITPLHNAQNTAPSCRRAHQT